jgi:hypothetical protein
MGQPTGELNDLLAAFNNFNPSERMIQWFTIPSLKWKAE